MRILILCTGNSCRSQMAQGILSSLDSRLEVFSAGTSPGQEVHPFAIRAMNELGIDISMYRPKAVGLFLDKAFDYLITVCDDAKENCPVFSGRVSHRLHLGFDDPAAVTGSPAFILAEFRRVRDEIKNQLDSFYLQTIRKGLQP
ncbi:Arsenate reductase [anaerobic digester metagenome]|nr:arsenate reductase ArsC [Lentimicrobiaceae bacterium]